MLDGIWPESGTGFQAIWDLTGLRGEGHLTGFFGECLEAARGFGHGRILAGLARGWRQLLVEKGHGGTVHPKVIRDHALAKSQFLFFSVTQSLKSRYFKQVSVGFLR